MRIGFLGAGSIASAIVSGLNVADSPDTILVSPRNASVAARLAATFPRVTVAASNQAVLDGSDVVMLAIRPQVASEVLASLRFQPAHLVISLMAIMRGEQVASLVAPASRVVRAIPLPMVATRDGITALYPDDAVASAIFSRLGTTISLEGPDQLHAFSTATATLAPYFAFAGEVTEWLARHQVPPETARRYVATIFQGLANRTLSQPRASFGTLAAEFATPGGINEQVMAHLTREGAWRTLSDALDAVLQRMNGSP